MTKTNFKGSKINIENSEKIEIGNIKKPDSLGEKIVDEVSASSNYVKVLIIALVIVGGVVYFIMRS